MPQQEQEICYVVPLAMWFFFHKRKLYKDGPSIAPFQTVPCKKTFQTVYLSKLLPVRLYLTKLHLSKLYLAKLYPSRLYLTKFSPFRLYIAKLLHSRLYLAKFLLCRLYLTKLHPSSLYLAKLQPAGFHFLNLAHNSIYHAIQYDANVHILPDCTANKTVKLHSPSVLLNEVASCNDNIQPVTIHCDSLH
jgi:hypothetical protein